MPAFLLKLTCLKNVVRRALEARMASPDPGEWLFEKVLPAGRGAKADSRRVTSSAKDRTCIFAITLGRCAFIVRSVQPNARATCLWYRRERSLRGPPDRAQSMSRHEREPCPAWFQADPHSMIRNRPPHCVKQFVR